MDIKTKEMVEEHAGLVVKINKLEKEVYGEHKDFSVSDACEFANKAIQLSSMKKYAECLEARLSNKGVLFENGQYMERIAAINLTSDTEKDD